MPVPVLKQGDLLIASIQSELNDHDLMQLVGSNRGKCLQQALASPLIDCPSAPANPVLPARLSAWMSPMSPLRADEIGLDVGMFHPRMLATVVADGSKSILASDVVNDRSSDCFPDQSMSKS
jgi:hypothetical protein